MLGKTDIVARRRYPKGHKRAGQLTGAWYENVTVRRPDGGRVRLRASTGSNDREIARALTADKIRRIALGLDRGRGPARITLNAALARYWLEHVCQGTTVAVLPSAPDIKRRSRDLLRLMRDITGETDPMLDAIGNAQVHAYRVRRRGEPNRNYRRGGAGQAPCVGPVSVNTELELLRAVMRLAREAWGARVDPIEVDANGAERLAPVIWKRHFFQEPDAPRRVISHAEQARVLGWCAEPENLIYAHVGDMLQVGIWTGLRRGNLARLDWSQIDMDGHELTVRRKSKRPGGRLQVLPIVRPFYLWLANRGPQAAGRVFTRWDPKMGQIGADGRRQGAWVTFEEFKHAWETVRRECGLAGVRWNEATRKTSGTRILAGGSLADAQIALGHADIQTTMRYLAVTTHNVRAAMERAAQIHEPAESHSRHTSDDPDADAARAASKIPVKSAG